MGTKPNEGFLFQSLVSRSDNKHESFITEIAALSNQQASLINHHDIMASLMLLYASEV